MAAAAFGSLVVSAPPSFNTHTEITTKSRRRREFLVRRRKKRHMLLVSSTMLLAMLPKFHRSPRRFWSAPRGKGFWENEVSFNWRNMGREFSDWEEKQYLLNYRVSKSTFWFLCETYGKLMKKEDTRLRKAIPFTKRFAILLHWLAQGLSFMQVSALYAVAKSTSISIIHEGVIVLLHHLVPASIKFPTGSELKQVIDDFESLCGLPLCAGAIDGTFMEINKPTEFGDTYYCYKHMMAIIVLGCVDARGIFTYVNAGRPGSVGDSCTIRRSPLYEKLRSGEWQNSAPVQIEQCNVKPYLVADSAFPLASNLMKCYEGSNLPHRKRSFNYSLIRTRRVVEQAFGRLKGRWRIVHKCHLNDPVFARQVALVCCALHNVCERHQCPFEESWLPDLSAYSSTTQVQSSTVIGSAISIREALAKYIHRVRPAP